MDELRRKLDNRLKKTEGGCWIYIGGCDSDGYGIISHKGVSKLAHRFAWTIYRGEIPKGMNVLHSCDVRNCCNPDHLWIGTQFQNCLDKTLKGRSCRKLSRELLEKILVETGSFRSIGLKYGVDASLIGKIKRGERWKVLPQPPLQVVSEDYRPLI